VTPTQPTDEPAENAAELGEAFAAMIGRSEWQLDIAEVPSDAPPVEDAPRPPPEPVAVAAPAVPEEPPPSPTRLIEALLFIGNPVLTRERAVEVVRDLTADQFRDIIDGLNRK
jgi:hypothetical protein